MSRMNVFTTHAGSQSASEVEAGQSGGTSNQVSGKYRRDVVFVIRAGDLAKGLLFALRFNPPANPPFARRFRAIWWMGTAMPRGAVSTKKALTSGPYRQHSRLVAMP
jgi:hypothetical protein